MRVGESDVREWWIACYAGEARSGQVQVRVPRGRKGTRKRSLKEL